MVFELELKPDTMRSMVVTFSKCPANVRGDRYEPEQVLFEEAFALIDIACREHPARRGVYPVFTSWDFDGPQSSRRCTATPVRAASGPNQPCANRQSGDG